MNAAATEVKHLLTSTRSARKTLDIHAPIDMGEIRACLDVGLHAANGSNQQAWRWIVVQNRDLRAKIAACYRDSYLSMTGSHIGGGDVYGDSELGRLMSSTEWLVDHLAEIPLIVIPCYEPWLPCSGPDDSFYYATMYGSIFPAVWNFQLTLHSYGYGTCITTLHLHRQQEIGALLGIPETWLQACLLPVGRLREGHRFSPAPRRPIDEVAAVDGWRGPPLVPECGLSDFTALP
jgi:nitroreductase